jgi:DNA relaxase NicK
VSSDGGSTAYIGSRVSECYARLYDKGVEQKAAEPGRWWRFELELKGVTAKSVAFSLQQTVAPAQQLQSIVADYARSRAALHLPSSKSAAFLKGRLELSTADRQLLWLSRGVRPTVQALVKQLGAAKVIHALGLSQSVGEVREPLIASEVNDGSCNG